MPDRIRKFAEGDDPRQDDETRGRIREIARGLLAWQESMDRRYHRVSRLVMVMVVGSLLAVMLGYALLQGQRWESFRGLCEQTNQQTEATVGLLRDLRVRPSVIILAQARYPHTPPLAHRSGAKVLPGPEDGYSGPMSCDDVADKAVGPFRL